MRQGNVGFYQLHSAVPTPDRAGFVIIYKYAGDGQFYSKNSAGVSTIIGGSGDFNNPYDFYLDGNVAVGGDGSIEKPFKTITELNNAVLAFPTNVDQYTANVAPYPLGYGNEVVGSLNIAENLNLIGSLASVTTINCIVNLTASGLGMGGVVLQYKGIAFNNSINIDLSVAAFAFVTIKDGQVSINRIDNNPSAAVILNGGIFNTTISGGLVMVKDGLLFGDIFVNPGATVYSSSMALFGGIFRLTGNSVLKTFSTYNPIINYVDGTVDGSGTPTWYTDEASDQQYSGTLNKIILSSDWALGGNTNGIETPIGTKDNLDFPIIANNVEVGRFTKDKRLFLGASATNNGSNAGFQYSTLTANRAQARMNQYGANNAAGGLTSFKSRGLVIGAPLAAGDGVQVGDIIQGFTGIAVTGSGLLIPLAYTQRVVAVDVTAGNVACDWEVSLCPIGGITNSIRKTFGFTSEGIQKCLETADGMAGIVTLDAGGGALILNKNIKANTRILLTAQDGGTVPTGSMYVRTRAVGVSFVINSTGGGADLGVVVYYQLSEPLI